MLAMSYFFGTAMIPNTLPVHLKHTWIDKNTVSHGLSSPELIIETVWDHLGSYFRWKTQLDDNNRAKVQWDFKLQLRQDRQAAADHHKDIMVVDKEQKSRVVPVDSNIRKNELKKKITPGTEGKT